MLESKNGFLQVSFGWLFAVIVGAVILFFAVYASVRLVNMEERVETTETGKEIAVLLSPLETGFGEEKSVPLLLSVESRINNDCNVAGMFGEQRISVSEKISGDWTNNGLEQVFYNKYIFSNETVQGKSFYLFSKPFNFPFYVSDLIYLIPTEEKYCFVKAPSSIQEEISDLKQPNLVLEPCSPEMKKVCFNAGSGCDIYVNANEKSITKPDGKVYYETDALMYAAIFSSEDIYECQVERVTKRLSNLALIYHDKESLLVEKGCTGEVSLLNLAESASSVKDSSQLAGLKSSVENAEDTNKRASCELW